MRSSAHLVRVRVRVKVGAEVARWRGGEVVRWCGGEACAQRLCGVDVQVHEYVLA